MKNRIAFIVLAGVLVSGEAARAQLEAPKTGPVSRLGFSYRPGFNINVDFKNLGGFNPASDPGPATGSGVDREYDDGYVRVDSSGNADGKTWFWGYDNASQLPGNDTVVMHSTSSPADVSSRDRSDDPQHGFELTYCLEWEVEGLGGFLGFEAAFNFMDLYISNNDPLTGDTKNTADAYSLLGSIAPDDPYAGTGGGSGIVISASPTRTVTTTPGGAPISGSRTVDGTVYGMRFGPCWRAPLSDKFSFSMSAGVALAAVDSRFKYRETVGGGSRTTRGSDDHDEVLAGGYVSASWSVALNESWGIVAGVQYQNVGSYTHRVDGKTAEVDLGESIFATIGVQFSF